MSFSFIGGIAPDSPVTIIWKPLVINTPYFIETFKKEKIICPRVQNRSNTAGTSGPLVCNCFHTYLMKQDGGERIFEDLDSLPTTTPKKVLVTFQVLMTALCCLRFRGKGNKRRKSKKGTFTELRAQQGWLLNVLDLKLMLPETILYISLSNHRSPTVMKNISILNCPS